MRLSTLALLTATLVLPPASKAADRPLWEFGLGATALTLPDYRGSDERHDYLFPLPYFVYRGDVLRADRRGLRTELFESDRAELDLSLNASLPVRSARNEARRGMPNLYPAVEFGPSLKVSLARSADRRHRLELHVPLRAAFAIDGARIDPIGWVLSPGISLQAEPRMLPGWLLSVSAGSMFASRQYHDYYYQVAPAYATPTRPAYDASGGYSGSQVILYAGKRFARFFAFGFARYDTLAGARFEDSPLVRSRGYLAAGLGIAWMLAESSERARTDD